MNNVQIYKMQSWNETATNVKMGASTQVTKMASTRTIFSSYYQKIKGFTPKNNYGRLLSGKTSPVLFIDEAI